MTVTLSRDGDLGVILIDNPPVNAASHAVRAGLIEALAQADADPAIRAMVLACAGRTFVAGADIREFGASPQAPVLPEVTAALEASAKPVVAALHGTGLGGGFELALAAHARIAAPDAWVGLPEVKLGVVPGAGGTQRLPRLAGMEMAVGMITSGRRISAGEALAAGVIDRVAEADLLTEAKALARSLIGHSPRRTGERPVPPFDRDAMEERIAAIERKARGQIAPGRAARLTLRAAETTLEDGLREERGCFLDLVDSSQARALRHVFMAEREAARVPGLEGARARTVETVGVVGGGLMGAGIAVAFLDAGWPVRLVERDEAAAGAARDRIEATYARMKRSGRLTEAAEAERLGRLRVGADQGAFAACDLIIEAVFDDLSVKQALFASLSAVARPEAILATNTSYLDPDEIATVIDRPERFLGLHFFSPANLMRLVEVVRTNAVSPDVFVTALAVVKRLGKLGVVSGVGEGFIGNRLFTAYRRECDFMLEDGALPHEIDAAMETFGFAMGPYAVNDMTGLDISWARRKRNAATRDPSERYVVIADRLCEAGRLGRKTGKGYYRYEDGDARVDPEVTAIIEAASREADRTRRSLAAAEIVARALQALTAEGRAILAEGIALRASDLDLVLINGYGYPAWRGGPMFEAGIA
jgi:3-hydroxyacyl-CoA dehydrogenase